MRIAVCDDESYFVKELVKNIYKYANLHNWEPVVDSYYSGMSLSLSQKKYDIIILDFQMDDINGIDTAKLLRKGKNRFSCIIFLTNYPEIAIPAYEVDTYRFVVKNDLFDGLYNAFDDYRLSIKPDYDISIKSGNEYLTIYTENKDILIHLSNNEIITTKTNLTTLFSEVPHTHFFKIHKSYIVNFKYIAIQGSNYIKLKGFPLIIPISRQQLSKFKIAYYNFIKDL